MVNEITHCRICGSEALDTVLDLGKIYPSAFLRPEDTITEDRKAPLVLVKCLQCGLVQLKHTVELDLMYRQYWYSSALNSSMVSSLKDIVDHIESVKKLKAGDTVIDIGSNDGTLLGLYSEKDLIKVGFDPAYNIKPKGEFEFVNDYFSLDGYVRLHIHTQGVRKAKVITAIAMFYDLPDPNKFVEDMATLLDDDGIIVIQLTDLYSMFKVNAFDNICHEHLEYYTLEVINNLLWNHGLRIVHVSYNNVNGGSVRIIATHGQLISEPIQKAISDEQRFFKNPKHSFLSFKHTIDETVFRVKDFLFDCKFRGDTVYIMGASTKGNTLLQLCGITNEDIKYAVEVNPEKFGLRTVGSNIEIIPENQCPRPDYFFVLPWHFIDVLEEKHKEYLDAGGYMVVPLPYFRIIGADEIVQKTLGFLVDELFTTDHKCWNAQEDIMNTNLTEAERTEAAIRAQKFNSRRNELIRAIDRVAGQAHLSPTTKSYYTYFDRKD